MDRRLLYALLFVSLALNVFVVGAFVGARLSASKAPPPAAVAVPAQRPRNPLAIALQGLPEDEQAAWRAQGPEFAASNGPKVRAARQLARQTMIGFGRDPFDAQAALADLKKARVLEHEARDELDQRIVAFAATLPVADRAAFGEALARPALGGRRAGGQGQAAALPNR